jgi:hypothetical protein
MEFGSGYPLKNNIAYYAQGSSTTVSLVKLVLNANQKSQAQVAHEKLLEFAMPLVRKATGEAMPESIQASIQSGRSGQWEVGDNAIRLLRVEWPTGKGYEVKLSVSHEG